MPYSILSCYNDHPRKVLGSSPQPSQLCRLSTAVVEGEEDGFAHALVACANGALHKVTRF